MVVEEKTKSSSMPLGLLEVTMTNSPGKRPRSFAIRSTSSKGRRGFLCQPVVDCDHRRAEVRHNEHMLFVIMMDMSRSFDVGILCEQGTDWYQGWF